MLPLLMALLLAPDAQASVVLSISPELDIGQGGNWGRAWPGPDGWKISFGFDRDYHVADLVGEDGSWQVIFDSIQSLTDDGIYSDHGIERCPDGGFLHVASANLDSPNDSAYATRISVDWQVLAAGPVEERVGTTAHNDMAVICSDLASGVTFQDFGSQDILFFPIETGVDVGDPIVIDGELVMTGGALLRDPNAERIIVSAGTIGSPSTQGIQVGELSPDLVLQSAHRLDVVDGDIFAYWPQELFAVGDFFLVAFMARPVSGTGDTGNVYLAVLDQDLQLQEVVQVSDVDLSAEEGGHRPGLARSGDTLLLTWDRLNQLALFELKLDLVALGVDPDDEETGWPGGSDSGWGDGGDGGDDGDEDDSDGGGGCGCAAGTSPGLVVAVLGALGLRRRRRG